MKILKQCFILDATIWIFVYAVKSFVIWDITNPFQWIVDMPKYHPELRFGILFFYMFYKGVTVLMMYVKDGEAKGK